MSGKKEPLISEIFKHIDIGTIIAGYQKRLHMVIMLIMKQFISLLQELLIVIMEDLKQNLRFKTMQRMEQIKEKLIFNKLQEKINNLQSLEVCLMIGLDRSLFRHLLVIHGHLTKRIQ